MSIADYALPIALIVGLVFLIILSIKYRSSGILFDTLFALLSAMSGAGGSSSKSKDDDGFGSGKSGGGGASGGF